MNNKTSKLVLDFLNIIEEKIIFEGQLIEFLKNSRVPKGFIDYKSQGVLLDVILKYNANIFIYIEDKIKELFRK